MRNRMTAVPYESGDIVMLGAIQNGTDPLGLIELQVASLALSDENRIYTVFHGKTPVAVCGFTRLGKGVAEAWSCMGIGALRAPVAFGRALHTLTDFVMNEMRLHRCQMAVRTDLTRAIRLAHSLGFECEGLMRRYNHNQEDHFLYARVQ